MSVVSLHVFATRRGTKSCSRHWRQLDIYLPFDGDPVIFHNPVSLTICKAQWGNKDAAFGREEAGQPRGPLPCQGSEYAKPTTVERVLVIGGFVDATSGIDDEDAFADSDRLLLPRADAGLLGSQLELKSLSAKQLGDLVPVAAKSLSSNADDRAALFIVADASADDPHTPFLLVNIADSEGAILAIAHRTPRMLVQSGAG